MSLNIRGINDLYYNRYNVTLDMIEKFHKMIESETYEQAVSNGRKIPTMILNSSLEEIAKQK